MNAITLHPVKNEARVDSRLLAEHLGITHEAVLKTIDKNLSAFQEFSPLRFEIDVVKRKQGGGSPTRYALLDENQSYLLLTFSRNTKHVVSLKVELVKAFSRFRQHKQTTADYLPFYHELHDSLRELADQAQRNGSKADEKLLHINFNKLINKTFGLDAGQRSDLPPRLRIKITTANVMACEIIKQCIIANLDHKTTYRRVKQAIIALATPDQLPTSGALQ